MAAHRVTIVGGGFGGLFAAKALGRADVDVTLIDRTNHHLFQPLLYQVATGILSEGSVAPPLRDILRSQRNAEVVLGEVAGVDLDARLLTVETLGRRSELPYDSLIVAAGAAQSYFGHSEFARYAPGMKTIDHALELRGRIFGALELAEQEEDAVARARLLTFVVVGAGPTGVELAGQLSELSRHSLRGNFRRIDPAAARVILLDAAPSILAAFPASLRQRAAEDLRGMGVEIHSGTTVTALDADGIETDADGPAPPANRGDDEDLGGRRRSVAARARPGRGGRRRGRPRRPSQGRARPHAAGTPGGLRGRRPDEPRRRPRCCAGRDPVGPPCRCRRSNAVSTAMRAPGPSSTATAGRSQRSPASARSAASGASGLPDSRPGCSGSSFISSR